MANLPSLNTDAIDVRSISRSDGVSVIDTSTASEIFVRRHVLQVDTADRSSTGTWTLGPMFRALHGFRAGSKLQLFYLVPMRNNEAGWGGAYIEPQLRIMNKNLVTNTNLQTGWDATYYGANVVYNEIAPPAGITAQTISMDNKDVASNLYLFSYGDYVPQAPNTTYKISVYVRVSNGSFNIQAYTADNSEAGRYNTEYRTVNAADGWARVEFDSFVSSSNSESDSLSFRMQNVDGTQRVSLCAPQMEVGTVATEFVDGTTDWQSLGSCGYDGGVMGYGPRIMSYRNNMLIDPQQTADFSVQFRFYFRSYNGTVYWNDNRDIGLVSGNAPLLTTKPPNTRIVAKQYPSDGTAVEAAIYVNGVDVFNYGRDWHISVWDTSTGNWATGINFYGATQIVGAHALYDVYNSTTRATQQQAFVDTINNLSSPSHVVIVAASHAPENYSAGMKTAILSIGGSDAKLNWTARSAYICVGKPGAGTGNAYREELNNLATVTNEGYEWARVDVNLTNNIADITDYGTEVVSSNHFHAHIKVKEIAKVVG